MFPLVAVRVVFPSPAQIAVYVDAMETTGAEPNKIFIASDLEQPKVFVPVTVYVICAVGFRTGFEIFGLLNPAEGFQRYVVAPVAFNVIFPPPQIVLSVPAFIVGEG